MLNFFFYYTVLLLYILISFVVSLILFLFTIFFSKKVPERNKLVAYECGFNSYSSARISFDVHFFIVALLFLVFDVELIFLYPWSMVLNYLNNFGIAGIYIFLLIIIVGYIYEWKKGALNWVLKF